MKASNAILFSIASYMVCSLAWIAFNPLIGFALSGIMVLSTSLWVAVDSWLINLKRYKSGISYGPVALFLGCVSCWIIAFPWYLVVRGRIKTGAAVLKNDSKHALIG